jgi:hypothetical protein
MRVPAPVRATGQVAPLSPNSARLYKSEDGIIDLSGNGRGRIMKLSLALALALVAGVAVSGTASAQMPEQCNGFIKLRTDAQQKASAIGAAEKHHATRKEVCTLVTWFSVAEAAALKFLEVNATWCGVPADAISSAKAAHEKTLKFRKVVCTEEPKPRLPTLSDALGTPQLDTAKNTKTGKGGTFDTLTGNPLAK